MNLKSFGAGVLVGALAVIAYLAYRLAVFEPRTPPPRSERDG